MAMNDIELTVAALEACGYRVKVRERSGTQWVTAVKVLQTQYVHWHPLTNISQAMQLLIDAPNATVSVDFMGASCKPGAGSQANMVYARLEGFEPSPAALINAQCRAIVTACASLIAVR